MPTGLPICDELAEKAKSRLVKDMMLIHYQRKFKATFIDQHVLNGKVTEVSERINLRAKLIKELQQLCGSDSSLQSITDLRRMQHEDLMEGSRLMLCVAQKLARLHDLTTFIKKLQAERNSLFFGILDLKPLTRIVSSLEHGLLHHYSHQKNLNHKRSQNLMNA
jgi:hypothetical protein